MRASRSTLFRYCVIASCASVVANACSVEPRPVPPVGRLAPLQYCPGDNVRASFDFLAGEICSAPSGMTCADFVPTVRITSAPEAFPPAALRGYIDGVTFTPTTDRVAVTFDTDRETVLIPTARGFISRPDLAPHTLTATRIDGTIDTVLTHGGVCAGRGPVNTPASVPSVPRVSLHMNLVKLCNINSIAVEVTFAGTGSDTFPVALAPGECVVPGGPLLPLGANRARSIEIRPLTPALGTMCSPTGPNTPPPPLLTRVSMACR